MIKRLADGEILARYGKKENKPVLILTHCGKEHVVNQKRLNMLKKTYNTINCLGCGDIMLGGLTAEQMDAAKKRATEMVEILKKGESDE